MSTTCQQVNTDRPYTSLQYTSIRGLSWLWSYGSWIYNYLCNQCLSSLKLWVRTLSWPGVLDTTLCDKVCQWLATGWWFSPGTPVSSTNKTERHNIIEILSKVALSTINLSIRDCLDPKFIKLRSLTETYGKKTAITMLWYLNGTFTCYIHDIDKSDCCVFILHLCK
jgi:hypothetical protein